MLLNTKFSTILSRQEFINTSTWHVATLHNTNIIVTMWIISLNTWQSFYCTTTGKVGIKFYKLEIITGTSLWWQSKVINSIGGLCILFINKQVSEDAVMDCELHNEMIEVASTWRTNIVPSERWGGSRERRVVSCVCVLWQHCSTTRTVGERRAETVK